MSVILGVLTVFLITVIVCLAVKIKKLQKGIFIVTDFYMSFMITLKKEQQLFSILKIPTGIFLTL